MARAADLNRKSSSGISYARAARKFGTTPEVVREYARQVKEFNRQTRQAAKFYGYKGEYWTPASLTELANESKMAKQYGGAPELFKFARENIQAKLADNVMEQWAIKAEQYVANIKKALTDSPESAFPDSDVSKALRKIDRLGIRKTMRATGGMFLQYWYPGRDEEPVYTHSELVDRILDYGRPNKNA